MLATDGSADRVFVADLSQATFSSAAAGGARVWSAPAQMQDLPELLGVANGTAGVSVASGTHLGILQGDSLTNVVVAVRLPSTAGRGTPALQDWVIATLPNDPSGAPWRTATHPDAVTSYVSPSSGKAVGLVVNETRTFIAAVELEDLLNAARSGDHTASASLDLVGGAIVKFVPIP